MCARVTQRERKQPRVNFRKAFAKLETGQNRAGFIGRIEAGIGSNFVEFELCTVERRAVHIQSISNGAHGKEQERILLQLL